MSPKTVSRALKRGSAPPGKRPRARGSILDPYKPFIDEELRNEVWNAEVLHFKLKKRGYEGGVTLIKDYIRPKRPLRKSKATVRFETGPGRQMQSDWGKQPARIAGVPTTARKWRDRKELPDQVTQERYWRTREDPFEEIWDEAFEMLGNNPGLEARTMFEHFQRKHPGQFADGRLRTFQRGIKVWRATEGPHKEIFFPQLHFPGVLSESDFTYMNELGITIAGRPFDHVLYHFVLTYSNWENATICFSENFQALSVGFQNAVLK